MCGIVGLYGETPLDRLDGMLSCITHRGPDGEGTFEAPDAGLAMGARRLSIVDLEGGSQPISNEDGTVHVVFNGEIYNHERLRDDLTDKGHRFETRCDTEVLVHLWEEYGPEMPTELRGMFAFSLWDERDETLFLARDRLGIKPLFYKQSEGSVRWGSELRPLLAVEDDPTVDRRALYNYFALKYTLSPRTMVSGIKKLPPGTSMTVTDSDDVTLRQYWDLTHEPVKASRGTISQRARELLDQSVTQRLMGDVPVGAFLSGGLDSAAVVGLMSQHTDPESIQTFSIGFSDASLDESSEARYVADHHGTDHTEITVDMSSFDVFGELVTQFGDPFADPAALPTLVLSNQAGEEVKTVLTGEGADELFAGYGYYRRWPRRRALARRLPNVAFDVVKRVASQLPGGYETYISSLSSDDSLILGLARQFQPDPQTYLTLDQTAESSGLAEAIARTSAYGDEYTKRLTAFDIKHWLPDDLLYKVDHATMHASLEARVPFLDTRLVEYMYGVPHEDKTAGGAYKPLLNRAVADVVPDRTRKRQKHGFNIPVDEWFRSIPDGIERRLSEEAIDRTPYVTSDVVFDIWEDHRRGTDCGALLWKFLIYVAWYNELVVPARDGTVVSA